MPLDPARIDTNMDDIVYNLNGSNLERTSDTTTTILATDVTAFSITEIAAPMAPATPTGLFQLTLTITRPSPDPGTSYNFTGTIAVQIRNRVITPLNIAFVVDNPPPPLSDLDDDQEEEYDLHMRTILGHNVFYFDDEREGVDIIQ